MKSSLSVFFPVFNGQAVIASQIAELLEILPELTPSFELVVIDDGSTDATSEVAHEISAPFPQVHFVVHPARWGQAAAMRTGLLHSSGQTVLVRGEPCELSPICLPKMCQALGRYDAVLGWKAGELRGRSSAQDACARQQPSYSLFERSLLDAWRRDADDDDWLAFASGRGRVCELEFSPRPTFQPSALVAPGVGRTTRSTQRHAAASGSSGTKRPNYLGRIKTFALGE